jgi:hypothetical protein
LEHGMKNSFLTIQQLNYIIGLNYSYN